MIDESGQSSGFGVEALETPMVTEKMIEAFWSKVMVTREGSIIGLEKGIECAILALQPDTTK